METFKNFQTLLETLKNDIKIENGLILENNKKYIISRSVNGKFENIILSQYKNSQDLILVETKNYSFTVSIWNDNLTISEQITKNTNL